MQIGNAAIKYQRDKLKIGYLTGCEKIYSF